MTVSFGSQIQEYVVPEPCEPDNNGIGLRLFDFQPSGVDMPWIVVFTSKNSIVLSKPCVVYDKQTKQISGSFLEINDTEFRKKLWEQLFGNVPMPMPKEGAVEEFCGIVGRGLPKSLSENEIEEAIRKAKGK
jgi:hypothetical protein